MTATHLHTNWQVTSVHIRTLRRHKERGLLAAGLDRRSHLMRWRIAIMKALLPNSARYAELAERQEAEIVADHERRGLFVEKFEREVEALEAAGGDAKAAGTTVRSLNGEAGSTLNACSVKVEKRKLSYKDGNGMFTLPEVVQDSWRRGQGMTWETPFPLPSSKRHKATVEKAQQAAHAESVADSTE